MGGVVCGVDKLVAGGAAGEEEAFHFLRSVRASLRKLDEAVDFRILQGTILRNDHDRGEELLFIAAENLHQLVIVDGFEHIAARRQDFTWYFDGSKPGTSSFFFTTRCRVDIE